MIDRQKLLSDLQSLLRTVEADLLARSEDAGLPEVSSWLKTEYESAKEAGRTAQTLKSWVDDFVTQVAAAWVLSCVFVRYLEDNALVDPPRIAGPAKDAGGGQSRLKRARDEYDHWVQKNRGQTDREYLLDIFAGLAEMPAAGEVFGTHNPLNALPNWLSGDAAAAMLAFFQKVDADTGEITHDFTDASGDTRFLGDLYQDLSEAARKKYALLQTPDFVEEFILDRTLDPALDEFGLTPPPPADSGLKTSVFRMIDPACGSGHFLLGAFPRILDRWLKKEPGEKIRVLVQRALDSVHGVDVNPYAIAIARFRLLLAALAACECKKLKDAPQFKIHLACGDSLWHAPLRGDTGGRAGRGQLEFEAISPEAATLGENAGDVDQHAYFAEDARALRELLTEGIYHCVVANPPYIVPKDRALNQDYRQRYESCHMKYSLAVPFMERIFRLAVGVHHGVTENKNGVGAGYTGQITANSFMKREFGKKLIEQYLPTVDLTHVIDTSGAYIPGHGTPTTILFGRNREPVSSKIRTVMGIRGEPTTPDNPAEGFVWSAIVNQLDQPGSESDYVSAGDSERERFECHPWSIGGGGAAELAELLEENDAKLNSITASMGPASFSSMDDAFIASLKTFRRHGIETDFIRKSIQGEHVRDWRVETDEEGLCLYDVHFDPIDFDGSSAWAKLLWNMRLSIGSVKSFGGRTRADLGEDWWTWYRWIKERYVTKYSIVFADIATHNHFVLDRGGKVFNRTAPVIKLPQDIENADGSRRPATEADHFALLGLLNCSTACFWMKQVCFPKGGDHVGQEGARVRRSLWDERYAFNATNIAKLPVPNELPIEHVKLIEERLPSDASETLQQAVNQRDGSESKSISMALLATGTLDGVLAGEARYLQEELDWNYYHIFGLSNDSITRPVFVKPLSISFGERAFEIALARRIESGKDHTTWFERHGSTPITDLPEDWPDDYKAIVNRRISVIESNPDIALIEQPEYKRRWNTESWESQVERALQSWLLDRLESYFDFDGRMNDDGTPTAKVENELVSIARLADIAARDEAFMEVGAVYRDDPAFNVANLVEDLVKAENVPLLPILRYKPAGLRKREQWEETWVLQRREDAGETDLDIPVPPKYKSSDFFSTGGARYWALRGKLDVPKERWISFPHCPGSDGTLMICWAGYDHLQQALAISAHYQAIKEEQGGDEDSRLIPLLACVAELIPWLRQWHNEPNADFGGLSMADYFENEFLATEARALNQTLKVIKAWQPPARTTRRRRTKS